MCSCSTFLRFIFVFRSLIHLEFLPVYGVLNISNLICFQIIMQLPSKPFLKILALPQYLSPLAYTRFLCVAAAAATKSLQSCLTLCEPINGSPPGSPVPGILQARTLEWVAISFSNACKTAQRYCYVCPLRGSQDSALRLHCFLIVPALSLHPLPSLIVCTCLLERREGPGG